MPDAASTHGEAELEWVRRTFSPQLHRLLTKYITRLANTEKQVRELLVEPAAGEGEVGSEEAATKIATVILDPAAFGNFTKQHDLGVVPKAVLIEMTSGGIIWFQTPTKYDDDELFLVASDGGITGEAKIFY